MENRRYSGGWQKKESGERSIQSAYNHGKTEDTSPPQQDKKSIQNFRDLKIWQLGKEIVVEVYKITRGLPNEELYGLITQMRRAAISIPCNIGEGHSRRATRDYQRFLKIAAGSCSELETQVEVAVELGYLKAPVCEGVMEKINHETRMLRKLISMLSENIIRHPTSAIQNKERVPSPLQI